MFLYQSDCNLGFIDYWLIVWLFEHMSTQHVNDGVIGIVFSLVYVSLKEFGVVGSDTYPWGIKDFHKCWLGSLAKRRLCLGPAGVINCTPLSALSFWVSLFPRTRGCNKFSSVQSASRVRLFVTPWIAACQASLSITNSRSSLRLTSIESVMPSHPCWHITLNRVPYEHCFFLISAKRKQERQTENGFIEIKFAHLNS